MVTIHYNGYKALLLYNDYNRMLPCPCGAVDWNIYSRQYMPIRRLHALNRLKTAAYVYFIGQKGKCLKMPLKRFVDV